MHTESMKTMQVHDGKFGWMRSAQGTWVIGGPAGATNKIVKVTKRDGSSKFYRTGSQLIGTGWQGATLYEPRGEVSDPATTTTKRWTYNEVDDMIADMDLEYKYPTRSSIWDAVRTLNAGGRL